MGMGVLLQKEPKIPDAHKTSAAISGPKIADKEFYEHGDCSEGGGGYSRSWGRGGTGAGRVSGRGLVIIVFFSPSKLPFLRRTVLGNSRGPCYQRDLPMQGIFVCWLSLVRCLLDMHFADAEMCFADAAAIDSGFAVRISRPRKIEE